MISFGYFGNRMEAPSNMEMTNEDEQEIKTQFDNYVKKLKSETQKHNTKDL